MLAIGDFVARLYYKYLENPHEDQSVKSDRLSRFAANEIAKVSLPAGQRSDDLRRLGKFLATAASLHEPVEAEYRKTNIVLLLNQLKNLDNLDFKLKEYETDGYPADYIPRFYLPGASLPSVRYAECPPEFICETKVKAKEGIDLPIRIEITPQVEQGQLDAISRNIMMYGLEPEKVTTQLKDILVNSSQPIKIIIAPIHAGPGEERSTIFNEESRKLVGQEFYIHELCPKIEIIASPNGSLVIKPGRDLPGFSQMDQDSSLYTWAKKHSIDRLAAQLQATSSS